MERLTLDEAIKHAKEVADMNYNDAEKFDSNDSVENYMKANCMKCAEQHEKLAEWLEELKSYKDIDTLKELKGLKENGAFTGLELAKLAIMQKELKEYKGLEEQGLLVRLPCKIGDTLYCIDNGIVELLIVNGFEIYNFNRIEIVFENASGFTLCTFSGELDEGYFLTREEAEKKLEEF